MDFEDALRSCANRKLELVSLSDKNKFKNCLFNVGKLEFDMQYKKDEIDESAITGVKKCAIANKNINKKFKADFWTSGAKLSRNASTWAWCNEKQDFNPKLLNVTPPNPQLCVKVNDKGVLESIDCSTKVRFICEVSSK